MTEGPRYVYIHVESADKWTVGHYAPDGTWVPESDHDARSDAVTRVDQLNAIATPPTEGDDQ